jgi:GTPase SAR1 family protein
MTEDKKRKKGIIILGITGTGKSTFINYLTGSKLKTSDGNYSCTSKCEIVEFKGNVIIDTPGIGDIRKDGKNIKNEDIFILILKEMYKYNIVGIVFMIEIEDLTKGRISQNLLDLGNFLKEKFNNWASLIYFGIKDTYNFAKIIDLKNLMANNLNMIEKLHEIGVTDKNYYICAQKTFEGLAGHTINMLKRDNPEFLKFTNLRLKCKQCNFIGNPSLVVEKCMHHDKYIDKHGETFCSHVDNLKNNHPGYIKGKRKSYTCCGNKSGSYGCLSYYSCCNEKQGSQGCQSICKSCGRNSMEQGCIGICNNCGEKYDSKGCIIHEEHDWDITNLNEKN